MSDPFNIRPPSGFAGFDWSGAAGWGQPAGGSMTGMAGGAVTEDMLRQLQYDTLLKQPGFQQQQLDIARQASAPPSPWQTGASTFGSIAQGLGGLGSIYLGLEGLKMQKDAFKFNKGVTNTNLNNSIMDYNRRLSDTLANRALNNGQGQGWVNEQLSKYSAKRS